MKLFLLRHGSAEDKSPGGSDAERKLTREGVDELRLVLEWAKRGGTRPELILSSPYVRAMETAAVAREVLKCSQSIVTARGFTPDSSPQDAWNDVRTAGRADSILVASHEPLLSNTVSWLLGATRNLVEMPKAALVRIDFERVSPAPSGVLRWMITPELARA